MKTHIFYLILMIEELLNKLYTYNILQQATSFDKFDNKDIKVPT